MNKPNNDRPAGTPGKNSGNRDLAAVLITCFVVLTIGVAYRMMLDIREAKEAHSQGAGGGIDAYGYDLSKLSVKRELLSTSNRGRDKFDTLYEPGHIDLTELATLNK